MSFVRSLAKLRRHEPEANPEWLVVGLGNPGTQYAKTRHNVGFMCTNRIAQRLGSRFKSSSKDRADVARIAIAGVTVLLAQPQTYMNESGQAVARLARRYGLNPDRIVIVYDDVDLPALTVRVRQSGSAGGHRGVQSIIDAMRTSDFPRVRVGIGRGQGSTKDYVLTEFTPDERRQLPSVCDLVYDIVESIVSEGVVAAMNRFNGQASQKVSAS